MVRRAAASLAILLLASAAGAQEPEPGATVEQIVARHVDARGGTEALAGLRSIKATGTHLMFSEPTPFTLWRERPDRVRLATSMFELEVIEAYDGERGWALQPPAGTDWPLPMTPPELAAIQSMADFDTPLIGWADKGHAVTLAGREDFDGVDAWRLEVERAEGFAESWFIDAATGLEVGKIGPAHDFGRPAEARTWFGDFRPVAGVMIPHAIESDYFIRHRRMELETVAANPELPDGLFAMPPLAGMTRLSPMAGEWEVNVELRPFPEAPWVEQEPTVSTISPLHDGAALEEEIAATVAGRTVRSRVTWSWDRFADHYRVTSIDDYTSHLNVFQGNLDGEGRLVASNAETGTRRTSGGEPVTERIVLSEVTVDGFTVERQSTSDEGESWIGNLRLTYTRPGAEAAEGGDEPEEPAAGGR